MDYKKIYDDFIVSRRLKQVALINTGAYKEVHHIKPRCLGGDNGKSNLVALTPEDHYFAHLLLANIYGGALWGAVFLMTGKRRWAESFVGRRSAYGYAKRKLVEHLKTIPGKKGIDNGHYNHKKFEWINLDTKDKRFSTLHEMWSEFGGSRPSWNGPISTNPKEKRSVYGWVNIDDEQKKRGLKGKAFDFVNFDGRTFTGRQKDFCESFGISIASASRVCRHGDVTVCGWRLSTTDRIDHKTQKNNNRPTREGKGKTFVLRSKDGELVTGKRKELSEMLQVSIDSFSACIYSIKKGQSKTIKGYTLAEVKDE